MKLNDNVANEIRLVANEIMRKLYVAGQREQLNILLMYADSAIKEIDKAQTAAVSQGKEVVPMK